MKENMKNYMAQALCVAAYLFFFILIAQGERNQSNFNGVYQAIQFLMCLLLVCIDYRKGLYLSYGLIAFSLLGMARVLLIAKVLSPLPGIFNMTIYLITLTLLSYQLSKREREIVEDLLTGLLNRRGLYRRIKAKLREKKPFSVIYFDLDNFKDINDNHGHSYGDEVLRTVANRMKNELDKHSHLARISGDEFVLVLPEYENPEEVALRIIDSITQKISLPVGDNHVECYLSSFAGISKYPEDAKDHQTLIKYADIAMAQATAAKSAKVCFFDKNMEASLMRQMELEKLILEGLENNTFYMVYQPQFHIKNKVLRGYESLLRLKTSDGTPVSPGEFIPVAEKSDLILKIDKFVLRQAMTEFRDIVLQTGNRITVSVNVSAKNIADSTFADRLKELMTEIGFPAQCLEVEITEYCLVQSMEDTILNIQRLRDMGVQVALDDFGTGYSSLSYLSQLPINLLKIDKSMVDDIENTKKSQDFISVIISMGHLMGCEVISEGVESDQQISLLNQQNCDLVQGYVWGKPLEFDAARSLALRSFSA